MVGGGCCTDGDEGMRALLPEWVLVFLDMVYLDGIEDVSLTFLHEMGLGPLPLHQYINIDSDLRLEKRSANRSRY